MNLKRKHLPLYACKYFNGEVRAGKLQSHGQYLFVLYITSYQRSKGLESENYNRMIRIFLLREYLFWLLYLPPSQACGARLAQSVEHETLNLRVVGSSPTLGAGLFLWLVSKHSLFCSTAFALNLFKKTNLVWRFSSERFFGAEVKKKYQWLYQGNVLHEQ